MARAVNSRCILDGNKTVTITLTVTVEASKGTIEDRHTALMAAMSYAAEEALVTHLYALAGLDYTPEDD